MAVTVTVLPARIVIVLAVDVGVRVAAVQDVHAGKGALSQVVVAFQLPVATER